METYRIPPLESILPGHRQELKELNRVLVYFDCKAKLCLIVPRRHGKCIFTQENFYLEGILNDISEQDTVMLTVNTSA